jgi:hypothetical protein
MILRVASAVEPAPTPVPAVLLLCLRLPMGSGSEHEAASPTAPEGTTRLASDGTGRRSRQPVTLHALRTSPPFLGYKLHASSGYHGPRPSVGKTTAVSELVGAPRAHADIRATGRARATRSRPPCGSRRRFVWQPRGTFGAAAAQLKRGAVHPPAPPCMARGGGICREEVQRSPHCTPSRANRGARI